MHRKGLAVGIILLFLVSLVPFIHGESIIDTAEDFLSVQGDSYQYMTDWSVHLTNQSNDEDSSRPMYNSEVSSDDGRPVPLSGPMDSPWPMLSYDVRHTGRNSAQRIILELNSGEFLEKKQV